MRYDLAFEIDKFFQQGIGNGDDPAVGLITALGNNHGGHFVGQIHVAHLESARFKRAVGAKAG